MTTLDQCMEKFGNQGALAGVFGEDMPAGEAGSAGVAIAESQYTPSLSASRSLVAELEVARRDLEAAENALADHHKTPRTTDAPVPPGGIVRRIGTRWPFRWLTRLVKSAKPAAGDRDRKKAQLEDRRETARRRYLSLEESVGNEQQRAAEEARQAEALKRQAIDGYERILQSEFESWKVRSRRIANKNRRES